MNGLEYCPQCGKATLTWNDINKWNCPSCGFTLYNNCAGAVAVVIRYEDEIFLTKRNQNPGLGKLDLSGGFVDPKESAEETCQRELQEELKIDIDKSQLKYLCSAPNTYHYKGIDYNTLDLFYEYKVTEKFSPTLAQDEISEYIWIKKSDINIDDLAFESQKIFFKEY